jgi:hypothetical protein
MKMLRWFWVGIIIVTVLYIGAELCWYWWGDFPLLHEWSTTSPGFTVKGISLLAIIAFGLVTEVISEITNRRRNGDPPGRKTEEEGPNRGTI